MVQPVFLTLALLCLGLITVHSFEITSSTPQQCGYIQISWTGSPAAQLKFPFFVNIIPFLSTAIVLPISLHIWNGSTTSGSLTLPFHQRNGTQFLFVITDKDGVGAAPVSEIKATADSQDSSCFGTKDSYPVHFMVQTTQDRSLCPSLKVSWDDTVKKVRPKILAFSPGMFPVDLDPSLAAAPLDRVVTSTGNFTSKSQVVVLFDDKGSPPQTSDLLTVGGTDGASCSESSPLPTVTDNTMVSTPSVNTGQTMLSSEATRVTNKAGIIIGIVVGTIVVFSALLFGALVYRQRRKRAAGGLIPHAQFRRTPFMKHSFKVLPSMPMLSSRPPPVPPKSPWAMYMGPYARNAGPSSPLIPYDTPPTPLPKSPSTKASRRRSYIMRTSSDASSFQYLNYYEGELETQGERDPRPDSATLPDPTFLRQFAEPTPPVTPGYGELAPSNSGSYSGGALHSWSKRIQ